MEKLLTHWEVKKEKTRNIKFALIYPNSYYLGMSNLGFQSIYYELNRRSDTYCVRVFLNDSAQLNQEGLTDISFFPFETQYDLSLRSKAGLREFDILGFSISFENDYFNIPKILSHAKIPPKASQRLTPLPSPHLTHKEEGGEVRYPLVIAGGISISYNPEPLADFADAFVIGEAEINIHNLLSTYIAWKENHLEKKTLLKNLTQLDGIYVPNFYDIEYNTDGTVKHIRNKDGAPSKIKSGVISNINCIETSSKILTDNTEFANTYLIEIARGCGRQCRFCIADYTRRPPRYRSLENTIQLAKQAQGHTNRKRECYTKYELNWKGILPPTNSRITKYEVRSCHFLPS